MSVVYRPLTYEDLFKFPDDGKRRELIGGELIVNPAPRRDHQTVSIRLTSILLRFLESSGEGLVYTPPVDVYVDQNDVIQPDLIVIRQSRLDIYRPDGVVVEPPDIVVEIISPGSQRVDRVGKMALYARFGVREYWIADPDERMLSVYVLEGGAYSAVEAGPDGKVTSRAFPGLRVDPFEVFAVLDG
jgi:Uma2 family endonuclease